MLGGVESQTSGCCPGGAKLPRTALYSDTDPEPHGYKAAAVRPAHARLDASLGEFALDYDDVRSSAAPEALILEFLESTYEAGATLAHWDRTALEQHPPASLRGDLGARSGAMTGQARIT